MKQIKDYIGTKTAIHCSTEEEAKTIIRLCYEADYKWRHQTTYWHNYSEEFCYCLDEDVLTYCSFALAFKSGLDILDAADFIEESSELPMFDITGEYIKFNIEKIPDRMLINGESYQVIKSDKVYEFGYPVGSLNWAYEVAKNEGEVWHNDAYEKPRKFTFNDPHLAWDDGDNKLYINEFYMTGWYRKPQDAKVELNKEVTALAVDLGEGDRMLAPLNKILEKYKIVYK